MPNVSRVVFKRFLNLPNTFQSKGIPCVTDCVMAELEKLGHRYRVALRLVISWRISLNHSPITLSHIVWPVTHASSASHAHIQALMPMTASFSA